MNTRQPIPAARPTRRHPILLLVGAALQRGPDGAFAIRDTAIQGFSGVLRSQLDRPDIVSAALQLITLAQMLEEQQASPDAANAVIELAMVTVDALRHKGLEGRQAARSLEDYAARISTGRATSTMQPGRVAAPTAGRPNKAGAVDIASLLANK